MARVLMRGRTALPRRLRCDEPADTCAHVWAFSGTAYGGDDERWHGEGRAYCELCGADGDA